MRTQKRIIILTALLYAVVIYFTPAAYLNSPKFIFLKIARFPLDAANNFFYELNYILRSKHLIEENKYLKQSVDILKKQLLEFKETDAENKRLQGLFDFKQNSPFTLVAVKIIARDSSNLSNTILLNKGKKSGIKENTVVITPAGLAGKVLSVSSTMSRAALVTDPNSHISALVSRSRELGMVCGLGNGFCKIIYLLPESDIVIGDEIVTSGLSDIYPKGLLIGRVIKVTKDPSGLGITALVRPSVDISKLEEALCIE